MAQLSFANYRSFIELIPVAPPLQLLSTIATGEEAGGDEQQIGEAIQINL